MNKQVMKCYLEVLSPLHVGCDEVYEPTGFSVDTGEKCLHAFDLMDFIQSLNPDDREKFTALCRRGTLESIRDLYRFMGNRKMNGKSVNLCDGFIDHYQRVLRLPESRLQNELNRFEIARTSYATIDQRPYIPGSSIKGALRTAYLNKLSRASTVRTPSGKSGAKILEETLLNLSSVPPKDKLSMDPFRLVKVSDFMAAGKVQTRVVYVVNKKKRPSEDLARGPYQIVEAVLPRSIFVGEISVEKPQKTGAASMPIELKELLGSVGRFYTTEKRREDDILKAIGVGLSEKPTGAATTLLRIGRHSGAECVTVEGHRQIRIMQGKKGSIEKDHATTVWLASETDKPIEPNAWQGLKPFGWAALGVVTDEMEQGLDRIERDYKEKSEKVIEMKPSLPGVNGVPEPDQGLQPKQAPPQIKTVIETWEQPNLLWDPGRVEVYASFGGKKAIAKGKELVPEIYHAKLFGKKKQATPQTVTVESHGNAWRIVEIV